MGMPAVDGGGGWGGSRGLGHANDDGRFRRWPVPVRWSRQRIHFPHAFHFPHVGQFQPGPRRFASAQHAPGRQQQTLCGPRLGRRALCRLPPDRQPLHLRPAPGGAHARGRVPDHGRHRSAQAQQYRLAHCRRGGRHLGLRLVPHGGGPGPGRAAGRSAVAALRGVSRRVCFTPARGGRPACGHGQRSRRQRQAPALRAARRHLGRSAQDVSQEPLPRQPACAQPAPRAGLRLPPAPLGAPAPLLHLRGGGAVPGAGR
ncbi:hypothetical protein FQZ97_870170 [compost metagenome]